MKARGRARSAVTAVVAILAGLSLAACGGRGSVIPPQSGLATQGNGLTSVPARRLISIDELNQWAPMYVTLPSHDVDVASLDAQQAARRTIPFFSGTVKSPLRDLPYKYRIAGADPRKSAATTNIPYVAIVLKVHFKGNFGGKNLDFWLDPTKPACGDNVSVANRFLKGPNFNPVPLTSNGANVGKVQITDGFQRAEFWKIRKGPGYHTVLKSARGQVVELVDAPPYSVISSKPLCGGDGHRVGIVPIAWMLSTAERLAKKWATTSQVAIFLTYNVFETLDVNSPGLIGGYHLSFGRGAAGTQVYGVGAYNDTGIFKSPASADINTWTHEFGDLLNNPFPLTQDRSNEVPAWGGVGQVPKGKCQSNLETGDPLTGSAFAVRYNGFTYHPQELAFFDWFYRTSSQGTGGKYSFKGTFKTYQSKICVPR
jgi:hypothetical protein